MIANLGQYVKLVHIFYQLILLFKEVKGRISFKDFQGIAIPPKISIPDWTVVIWTGYPEWLFNLAHHFGWVTQY